MVKQSIIHDINYGFVPNVDAYNWNNLLVLRAAKRS